MDGDEENARSTRGVALETNRKQVSHLTKFRYIIHGVPLNKRYTVEEARWNDSEQQFVSEQIHTIHALTLKQWLGYIPSTVGDMTTVMWMGFPESVWDEQSKLSPLQSWESNRDLFAPHSLYSMRCFDDGKMSL